MNAPSGYDSSAIKIDAALTIATAAVMAITPVTAFGRAPIESVEGPHAWLIVPMSPRS